MWRDGPGIFSPAPLLYAVVYGLGVALTSVWPLPWLHGRGPDLLGGILLAIAIALGIWGLSSFARAGTSFLPFHEPRALITRGPFRFTRNPLYLALALAYAGAALVWELLWPLLLLPVAIGLVTRRVIHAEEAYLEKAFGEDYRAYRRRVRRWLGQRSRSPLDR